MLKTFSGFGQILLKYSILFILLKKHVHLTMQNNFIVISKSLKINIATQDNISGQIPDSEFISDPYKVF